MGIEGNLMKKKILVTGPALTTSGYGEQARFALRSLRSREDLFDIYLDSYDCGALSTFDMFVLIHVSEID